jgi:hypothetical protein
MAHFDTGSDILANFLRRAGELFPNDTTIANADRNIDAKLYATGGYWDFCGARPWRWARLDPPIQVLSTAKQAVTANSISGATVTLSATIATTQAGRKFYLDADAIPHRISAHTAGTAILTLVTTYAGSGTSGAGTIFLDELTLTSGDDILAYPLLKEMHAAYDEVTIIGEAEFITKFGRNVQSADSVRRRFAAFITENKVQLGPWPTEARLFECSYNQRPSPLTYDGVAGTDTPVCPRNQRELIGLYGLRRLLIDKRDKRVEIIDAEIREKLALYSSHEISFSRPRVYVRRGSRVML